MKQEELFFATGIIPVINIDTAEKAVPLAEALLEAGISIAESLSGQKRQKKG
jgi:2-keto-3-deoxy-6-phosphogluconate aldolase